MFFSFTKDDEPEGDTTGGDHKVPVLFSRYYVAYLILPEVDIKNNQPSFALMVRGG